ncbi:MAG: ATP-binding cassette domain-containing protein, partial [Gemmobacter sp.]
MMTLDLRDLTVRRGGREVLSGATLAVGPGEFVGLLGPNGAGKTTLLRAALGLEPHEGQSNLARLGPERRARAAAFLPQGREIAWPVAVAEVVALGRAGLGDDGGRIGKVLVTGIFGIIFWTYCRRRSGGGSGGGREVIDYSIGLGLILVFGFGFLRFFFDNVLGYVFRILVSRLIVAVLVPLASVTGSALLEEAVD